MWMLLLGSTILLWNVKISSGYLVYTTVGAREGGRALCLETVTGECAPYPGTTAVVCCFGEHYLNITGMPVVVLFFLVAAISIWYEKSGASD